MESDRIAGIEHAATATRAVLNYGSPVLEFAQSTREGRLTDSDATVGQLGENLRGGQALWPGTVENMENDVGDRRHRDFRSRAWMH